MTATVTAVPTATLCANLAALAGFLAGKALPELPYITSSTARGAVRAKWMFFGDDLAEQKAQAAAVVRSLGGHWDKDDGDLFRFTQDHDGFTLEVIVDRPAVCERVVVGSRAVERVVPAVEAAAEHVVTETVEDVRWDCTPLLAESEQVAS